MAKYLPHFVVILIAVVCGTLIASQIFGFTFSLPSRILALTPKSVGNKAAPIPKLVIDNAALEVKNAISTAQIKAALTSSLGNTQVLPKYLLQEYQLNWKVSVEDGTLQPVTAQVFVPLLAQNNPNQEFPIIVYGTGSTGLADRCAPSRENLARGNMGNYRNYMISEASQGYIVVMPNYEGFDNPHRNQHYFNKDNEARTMLSAGKALLTVSTTLQLPVQKDALFLGGYSQGGHAAFSAADYASTYVPELKIAGVYGHGPTTNISKYLLSNPNLAAYFFASYSEYYPAIVLSKILEPKWIGYLENARKLCVDEGFGINSTTVANVFADPFEKSLRNNTLATDFPEISKIFEENNAGTSYVDIPTMIVQGTTDPVVTEYDQDIFVRQLCQRGVTVNLKKYKGVHHFSTRQVSFADTNVWIDSISKGQSVSNSCQSN